MDNNVYEFECLTLDVPNKNNRIYPKAVMEREIARYKKQYVDERRAMVTLYNDTSFIDLNNVVGIVTELSIIDNKLTSKVEVLDTPAFHSLCVNGKFDKDRFKVTTAGTATLENNVIQDNFELLGFHISLKEK